MNKEKKLLFTLIGVILISSCNANISSNSSSSSSQEEISSLVSSDDKGDYNLKNDLLNLNLKGYIGTNLKNNIKYWQKSAYQNNPNIITQIRVANTSDELVSLSNILGNDYFGVDSSSEIDILEKDGEKYIGWILKSLPTSYGDRDFRFSNDPHAITSWKGAKELLIHVDNSQIDGITSLRLAFEENTIGRESYSLIKDSEVYLLNNGKSETITTLDNGYIEIPPKFVGYVALPLDINHFACYWSEGGNKILELDNVVQFQISIKGTTKNIDKPFYMNNFAIVGDFEGNDLSNEIGFEENSKIVWDLSFVEKRKEKSEEPSSLAWYGEFVGKLLTGIAFSYRAEPSEDLFNEAETIINDLFEAQGDDGYLGVFKGGARYSISSSNWDLWNQYHCVVGLLEWYKNSGNEKALSIAKKTLDCIYETFKNRSYIVSGGFETNRGIAHGFALMYQISREEKYLKEAERIIQQDCRDNNGWYNMALKGNHFYKSSSARWEVLHMIMTLAILYQETQNEEYFSVMDIIWHDILETDIHNDGGFTTNEGAIGDPYRDGVIETCCSIAWNAFSNEFLKINKDVSIVDEIERTYFNAIQGSLLDNDKYCTYNTPVDGVLGSCGGYNGLRVASQQDISFQFNNGSPDMNCCQANLARGLGQISEWAIMAEDNDLYLNYYGSSTMETRYKDEVLIIDQETNYPINGKIKLTISGLSKPTEINLKLRIPSWSKDSKVKCGGKEYSVESNQYFSVDKLFNNGDIIELDLGMSFTCWKGEKSKEGKTSLYYGPILLTLDEYYMNKSNYNISFDKNIEFSASKFAEAKIIDAKSDRAWLFVDVPYNNNYIRLVDFASAGKFNGNSQPYRYYSWLNINNLIDNESDDIVNRWKLNLY